MVWVFHIMGRYIRVHTDSTCVQLSIPYTFVRLSPVGSIDDLLGILEDTRIPPAFNSVFLDLPVNFIVRP